MNRLLKLITLFFVFSSCHRDILTIEQFPDNEIIVAFEKVKSNTIERDVNYSPGWKGIVEFEGSYYIPLSTDKKVYSYTEDGTRYSLSNKSWLRADKRESDWQFTLVTVLPSDINDNVKSGVFLYEDWITGNKSYDGYIGKKLLRGNRYQKEILKLNDRIVKNAALSPPGEYCEYVSFSICVDFGGGLTCTYKTEWVCNPTTLPGAGQGPSSSPNQGSGGNSGGSGGGNSTPPIIFDCAGVRYGRAEIGECGKCIGGTTGISSCDINLNELSEEEKRLYQRGIDSLNKRCGFKMLIEKMGTSGNITIVMNSDHTQNKGGGKYYGESKNLVSHTDIFKYIPNIIAHEMFHAYQHQLIYGAKFINYSKGKPGYINIEFEQIVFNDIITHISMTRDKLEGHNIGNRFTQNLKEGYDEAYNSYKDWINQLTNNGTSYPNLASLSDFENEYKVHLNRFLNYGVEGYTENGQILNIAPTALKNLFNNTLNCNN